MIETKDQVVEEMLKLIFNAELYADEVHGTRKDGLTAQDVVNHWRERYNMATRYGISIPESVYNAAPMQWGQRAAELGGIGIRNDMTGDLLYTIAEERR